MTHAVLRHENRQFAGTCGLSTHNRAQKFLPAFRDEATGRVEIARFANGRVAPMHLLSGLPVEWATQTDADGHITAVLPSIVAGFVRNNEFFTRAEAAAAVEQ